MDDEAARAHGRQRLLRLGNPVRIRYDGGGFGARREAGIGESSRGHARAESPVIVAFEEPLASLLKRNQRKVFVTRRLAQDRGSPRGLAFGTEAKNCLLRYAHIESN